MNRIIIISHYEIGDKRINLKGKSDEIIRITSEVNRWSKVYYNGSYWDELELFGHLLNCKEGHFNIWQMPLYSGLHLKSVIRKLNSRIATKVINVITHNSEEIYFQEIDEFKPDAIFVSTTFYLTFSHFNTVIRRLRKRFPMTTLIIGGNYVFKELYINPHHHLLRKIPKNCFIVNSRYGERELELILNGCLDSNQDNIIVDSKMDLTHKPERLTYNVDKRSIDYELIEFDDNTAPFRTAVGCSFSCAFCSYPAVGGPLSMIEVDTVIDQLKVLKQKGVKQVHILDDTLNVPVERFKELLDKMLKEDLTSFYIYSFIRCQFLDEETVRKMKQLGWSSCLLGIESGSDIILKNMNKSAKTAWYREGLALLKKYDIKTFSAIIIGYPGETDETVRETVDFLNSSTLDYCYVQPFYYLHNTPIHQNAGIYGLIGKGLRWKHNTMDSNRCFDILNDIFFNINTPLYVNEEYAMWELIYFRYKGLSITQYNVYRRMINTLRSKSLKKYKKNTKEYKYELSINDFHKYFKDHS